MINEDTNTHVGLLSVSREITNRKKAREKLRKLNNKLTSTAKKLKQNNEELIVAKQRAEENERLKTAFLQNMLSHEIRTPLNAICGFSDLLNKNDITENERRKFVSVINNSSKRLLTIVEDILLISSLNTKQEEIVLEKVCINEVIKEVYLLYNSKFLSRNIKFFTKKSLPDEKAEIYSDKNKIIQILTNLVSNALKFTQKGIVEIGYGLKNNQIEFYVKDTGIGIQKKFHEQIFEYFRQVDYSTNRKYEGAGLGLAISKGLVELLGGKIWVESAPEKGTVFYFTIPCTLKKAFKTKSSKIKNKKLKTILIAEDEEYNFLFIEYLLMNMNCKLLYANNGYEAVQICKSNHEIDLVLMDIKMPFMDGYTAAKKIKEIRPELSIIAQSVYSIEKEIKEYGVVFDDYITKPLKSEVLISKIR